jgi:hypothetical protein
MDVAFDLARDDLCLAVKVGGILDQAADQKRHVHHQSLHRSLRTAVSLNGVVFAHKVAEVRAWIIRKRRDTLRILSFPD